jgi:hypothetical protein
MKNYLFIITFFLSFEVFSACKVGPDFLAYTAQTNFFSSDNPKALLENYSKTKKIPLACSYEMLKGAIPVYAVEWATEARTFGCFNTPPGELCDEDLQNIVLSSLNLFDQWGQWLLKNKNDLPEHSLCADLVVVPSDKVDKLTKSLSPIMDILNHQEKSQLILQTQNLNCKEDSVANANDSKNLEYFKQLLKKGESAPLEDFLTLWYPDREAEFEEDPYFFDCQKQPWMPLTKMDKKKFLVDECKPDVLYSWGPEIKLDNMKERMPDNKTWSGSPNYRQDNSSPLFMSMSPVSTFGYGDVSVRIKVKKTVPFKSGDISSSHAPNTIKVRNEELFNDFTTKDSNVIESWSYGTPEHYDEIVRDIKRFKSQKRAQSYFSPAGKENSAADTKEKVERYSKTSGDEKLYYDLPQYGTYSNLDGYDFDETILKQRLLRHIEMVVNGEGRIHYGSEACRNRVQHFRTKRRTYFNPH